MTGADLPELLTEIPGPRSRSWVDRLALRECPAVTARRARRAAVLGVADTDPIVWDEALGANVRDVDGNRFIDLSSGFGVATVGHRDPAVVEAAQRQAGRLVHAMGDAFPDPMRVRLLERLCALTGMERGILGSSGSDAVEAALKTARMATGRDAVLAFGGSYHGLSYGALSATDYKSQAFRAPFAGQLGQHVRHAPFGGPLPDLRQVGAVIVEPIQGRGGMREPPDGWLEALRRACSGAGSQLIYDEIYTGFGRTGQLFAFSEEARPDLLCVGKGMAGGFPISACLGTAEVMDAWGASRGEALHTQTFLGNPVGCAMALACIDRVLELLPRVGTLDLAARLRAHGPVRGRGLMLGLQHADAPALSRRLLERGFIALPAGEEAEVLAVTPPLCISEEQVAAFLSALSAA